MMIFIKNTLILVLVQSMFPVFYVYTCNFMGHRSAITLYALKMVQIFVLILFCFSLS